MAHKHLALLAHPACEVRSFLREQVRRLSNLEIAGEVVCVSELIRLLSYVPYRFIFLGTEIFAETSGPESVPELFDSSREVHFIFIAENESLAYKAYEIGALDYLIWPFDENRFKKTIEKINLLPVNGKAIMPVSRFSPQVVTSVSAPTAEGETNFDDEEYFEADEETVKIAMAEEDEDRFIRALKQAWDLGRVRTPEIEKLAVSVDGRMILIPYSQIIFIEAYEDYCYIHAGDRKFLASYRIKALEDRLKPHSFFRVHRKYLVNLDMVTEIASLPGSNFMLRTAGKTRIELPVSRRRIADLKMILGL